MRIMLAVLFVVVACGTPISPTPTADEEVGTRVNAAEFGAGWPLTVSEGWLRCEQGAIVFRAPDGADYAVNDEAAAVGFAPIDPLLAGQSGPDQTALQSLIALGLVLC